MTRHRAIYRFRGADIRNITEFEQDFPDARVILLEQNYRSTEIILDAANGVIRNNPTRNLKRLWTDLGKGDLILTFEGQDEHDEAGFVAEQVGELGHDGIRASDVAVFYRTNAQSRVIEETLVKFGVPYQVIGGLRYYDRREVKDALAYLRALVNTTDVVALKRIVNTPEAGHRGHHRRPHRPPRREGGPLLLGGAPPGRRHRPAVRQGPSLGQRVRRPDGAPRRGDAGRAPGGVGGDPRRHRVPGVGAVGAHRSRRSGGRRTCASWWRRRATSRSRDRSRRARPTGRPPTGPAAASSSSSRSA